jgi:hypothetical protein
MLKYRKRPVVIEAFQLGEHLRYPYEPKWFMDAITNGTIQQARWTQTGSFGASDPLRQSYCSGCFIVTLEGVMQARTGDYIIQGVSGEIYPCKPDIFEKTYEPEE